MQFLVYYFIFDQLLYLCYSTGSVHLSWNSVCFADVKAWRTPSLLLKFILITDNRRQERCIVKIIICM